MSFTPHHQSECTSSWLSERPPEMLSVAAISYNDGHIPSGKALEEVAPLFRQTNPRRAGDDRRGRIQGTTHTCP